MVTSQIVAPSKGLLQPDLHTKREGAPDTTTKETVKSDNAMPQFRVISIKNVADTCS